MDKSARIENIKAKIALLDAEKEQLLKKLCNIEKETVSSTDSLSAILENPSKQPISLDKKLEFTPLEKTADFNPVRNPALLRNVISNGVNQRSSPIEADGGIKPTSAQTVRERSSLTGFTQEQQIKLFRSLFRGRDDVHARLWVSRKTGESGYSPVCKNEWVPKVCQKPVMKCSHCPNRELMALDDEVIRRHLSGACVVGICPMLQDETCYFLAVDFDGEHWAENVFAFRKTCEQEGVPIAVERSRSGNGAHVWMFFKENISASLAGRMGSFLITKTMFNRYQLDMKIGYFQIP
jgi:hypothetical protein